MRDFKALFFTGLTLIISGILLKISTPETWISSVLISLGGTAKILFLVLTLRKNKLRPGYEMLFLLAGLALVILGAQLRKEPATLAFALPATLSGLLLKVSFVLLFIRRLRLHRLRRTRDQAI